ncbi:MAG: hypothetical protein ACNYNX_07750 [Leucobacter sp.]
MLRSLIRMRDPLHGDRGAALPMVLLVFVLSVALVTAFMISIVGASQVTSSSKASVQAQAAAEAGIASVTASLNADPCTVPPAALTGSVGSGSAAAGFTASVTYGDGTNWGAGCESSTHIRVTSAGVAGTGRETTVETIYQYTVTSAPTHTQGGPSLIFTETVGNLSNFFVDQDSSETQGDFYARSGDIACWNDHTYTHSFYVLNGSFTNGSSCTVEGDVYAGGTVTLQGVVQGNVLSRSTAQSTIHSGGRATGNFATAGTLNLNGGRVDGDVTLGGTGTSGINGPIGGNLRHRGPLSTNSGTVASKVAGTITQSASTEVDQLPVVPPWQDVQPDLTNWTDAHFAVVTVPAAQCSRWTGWSATPIWPTLSAVAAPTVYDVRACPEISTNSLTGSAASQRTLSMRTDLAFIVNAWDMSGMHIRSADGGPHTAWFVTPDGNPAQAGPQCTSGAKNSELKNSSSVSDDIAVYLYTPCEVNFNGGVTFRGQVYAGRTVFNGGATLAFAPRSIPGYDFSEGSGGETPGIGSGSGSAVLGALVSQRNIG